MVVRLNGLLQSFWDRAVAALMLVDGVASARGPGLCSAGTGLLRLTAISLLIVARHSRFGYEDGTRDRLIHAQVYRYSYPANFSSRAGASPDLDRNNI